MKVASEISSDDQEKEALDDPIEENLCQQRFVSAEQMTNFSNLTHDMLVEIAKRVKKLEDFIRFRSVSKSLRATVKEEYFEGLRLRQGTPYLMLPVREDGRSKGDVRDFYSLIEGESIVASLEVPAFKKITMCCESLGWLLAVQEDGINSMSLIDPFSNTEIPVSDIIESYYYFTTDPERMFIEKMVLYSRPNETSDFILMVICGRYRHLAFWRPGDEVWNWVDDVLTHNFIDVCMLVGNNFMPSVFIVIWVINLAAGNVECRTIIKLRDPEISLWGFVHNLYIVKTNGGSLLRVRRTKELTYYLTSKFEVSEIDTEKGTLKEIDSLGSMAVFLGRNSSVAVDASKCPRGVIKANHIYFTDDFGEIQNLYFTGGDWREFCDHSPVAKAGGVDSGVYNMETRAIEPIYPLVPLLSNVCPAMFITHF